jgi:hypothetical protein
MTVSFSRYLPWQAIHFLQRSNHFSKTCCKPLITSKYLASELPFRGWKRPEIVWGGDLNLILCLAWKKWICGTPLEHPPYSLDPTPCDFFPTMKREFRGKKFRNDQLSSVRFSTHCLPRDVFRKTDCHRTSSKFRLGVIRRVHELFKRPSYINIIESLVKALMFHIPVLNWFRNHTPSTH